METLTSEQVRGWTQLDVKLNRLDVFRRSAFDVRLWNIPALKKAKKYQMGTNASVHFNNNLYKWLFFMLKALLSLVLFQKGGTLIMLVTFYVHLVWSLKGYRLSSFTVSDSSFSLRHLSAIWRNATESMSMSPFLITFQWRKWVQSSSSCLLDFSPSGLWLCLNLLTFWL